MSKQRLGIVFMGKPGGGEYMLNRMVHEFTISNLECELVIMKSTFTGLEITSNRFKVFEFKTSRKILGFIIYLFQCWRFFLGASKARLDRVFFVQTSPFDFPFHIMFLARKIPQYISVHETDPHPGDIWPLRMWSKITCFFADRVIVYSLFTEREVEKKLFTNRYFRKPIIRLEIPVGVYSPNYLINKNSFQVLCIGGIKAYKGIDTLVRAARLVDRNFVLQIVGSGDLDSYDFLQVRNLQLVRAWLSNEHLFSLIWNADLVVLPYTVSSQSGILAIAMAFKKNVLISDIDALTSQAKDYEPCRYFKSGDVNQLAAEITNFIDSHDPEQMTNQTMTEYVPSGLWSSEFAAKH